MPVSPWFHPVAALDSPVIQRKAGCACGGGCPGCKEKLDDRHVQTKLAISTPGDQWEQEADRVAERVTHMPTPSVPDKCTARTESALPIRRARDSSAGPNLSVSDNFLSALGHGAPLDAATRNYFEPRFGADFGNVRVHADGEAAASARAISARAYTLGRRIVFGTGEYRPQTDEGRSLLAHELTHVVQQSRNVPGGARIQRACGPAAIGTPAGCTPVSGDAVGERFLFAVDCDSLLVPGEQARLELFADTIADGETIEIHGYASTDGDASLNESLSCARALRAQSIIQSILTGKGVSAAVGVFMHGATYRPESCGTAQRRHRQTRRRAAVVASARTFTAGTCAAGAGARELHPLPDGDGERPYHRCANVDQRCGSQDSCLRGRNGVPR